MLHAYKTARDISHSKRRENNDGLEFEDLKPVRPWWAAERLLFVNMLVHIMHRTQCIVTC